MPMKLTSKIRTRSKSSLRSVPKTTSSNNAAGRSAGRFTASAKSLGLGARSIQRFGQPLGTCIENFPGGFSDTVIGVSNSYVKYHPKTSERAKPGNINVNSCFLPSEFGNGSV